MTILCYCYSELIQAIEKDHKGIRRKAAQAAKADGPFPTQGRRDEKPPSSDILEEMDEMVKASHSRRSSIAVPYESALIHNDNPRYRTTLRSRAILSQPNPLVDSDFEF